jgi:hypothetical protein
MSVNRDNVLVSGGDNGSVNFWDYKTGYNFQSTEAKPQPGAPARTRRHAQSLVPLRSVQNNSTTIEQAATKGVLNLVELKGLATD